MTLIDNGNVLVCGGHNGTAYFATCEIYTPSTNLWATFPSLSTATSYFTLVTLNEHPYILGGLVRGVGAVNTVFTFLNGVWTDRSVAPIPIAIYEHAAIQFLPTTALVCGGRTTNTSTSVQSACFTFSAPANHWTPMGPLHTARAGHGMIMYNREWGGGKQ
jgi:hypothetical protein